MIGKIVMTAFMIFGALKPELFIKVTEFWKLGRKEVSDKVYTATRVLCVLAIVLIWVML